MLANCQGTTVSYEIVRSRRRTLCIEVKTGGIVIVRAPMRASQRRIDDMLRDKWWWIIKHLSIVPCHPPPHQFVSGETFLFQGNERRLRVEPDGQIPHIHLAGDELVVFSCQSSPANYATRTRQILTTWYFEQARRILLPRLSQLAGIVGVRPSRARVSRGSIARWGSCSSKGSVNLNWKLIMAPPEVADYVIYHELCHLKVPNHSKSFWAMVDKFDPGFQQHQRWLRMNAPRLNV